MLCSSHRPTQQIGPCNLCAVGAARLGLARHGAAWHLHNGGGAPHSPYRAPQGPAKPRSRGWAPPAPPAPHNPTTGPASPRGTHHKREVQPRAQFHDLPSAGQRRQRAAATRRSHHTHTRTHTYARTQCTLSGTPAAACCAVLCSAVHAVQPRASKWQTLSKLWRGSVRAMRLAMQILISRLIRGARGV